MASEASRRIYVVLVGLVCALVSLAAHADPASAQLLEGANAEAGVPDLSPRVVPRTGGFVQAAICGSVGGPFSPPTALTWLNAQVVVAAVTTRHAAVVRSLISGRLIVDRQVHEAMSLVDLRSSLSPLPSPHLLHSSFSGEQCSCDENGDAAGDGCARDDKAQVMAPQVRRRASTC